MFHSNVMAGKIAIEVREVPASYLSDGKWWIRVPAWLSPGHPMVLTSDPDRFRREIEAASKEREAEQVAR